MFLWSGFYERCELNYVNYVHIVVLLALLLLSLTSAMDCNDEKRVWEGVKKLGKSGQADRLGWPPPSSGHKNVKNFDFELWLWFMILCDL